MSTDLKATGLDDLKIMSVDALKESMERLNSRRIELATALRATQNLINKLQKTSYEDQFGVAANPKIEALKSERLQIQSQLEPMNNIMIAIVEEIKVRLLKRNGSH